MSESMIVAVETKDHRLNVSGSGCRLMVVKGGRGAYLWIGDEKGKFVGTIHGPKALRAIANSILAELSTKQTKQKKSSKG